MSRASLVTVLAAVWTAAAPPAFGQEGCGNELEDQVANAWEYYRADAIEQARAVFLQAVGSCPEHPAALTGLGYTELRLNRLGEARQRFEAALARHPHIVDALVGIGLVAWREGDHATARTAFEQVLAQDPGNEEARRYLPRLAPLHYPARVRGDRFEVRTPEGWVPFYVKGVNLGAAVPGHYPSEFPDSLTYVRWIRDIGELGANAIRTYTIHPPRFYQALREYNLAHPEAPLRLIHGVWVELPPGDDYGDPAWNAEVDAEIRRVVDLVHGYLRIPPRPGHASGVYNADVSPWTLAYIVGREWEPHSVEAYNARRPGRRHWQGRYLRLEHGNAMDAWLAAKCDGMIAYEMTMYAAQRPIAYTNWPTLDPLSHPTEPTAEEEVALRAALGEPSPTASTEYDNDAVTLDASLVRPTFALPAGYFAAYHIYPYYPDFMILDPGYAAASSPEGPSPYFGYLQDLKAHHRGLPVLVAEYGVPASQGIAHLHPLGWHHGGHSEAEMASLDARMTREIAAAGMAGGIVFAWIDEWFKKSWLFSDFLLPLDRNRLWLNRLDPEQHYGIVATEPAPRLEGDLLSERLAAWQAVQPLYADSSGVRVRALADEAVLWLLFEPGSQQFEEVFIGFDLLRADAGSFSWPDLVGPPLPVGVEFVLRAAGAEARLLADPASLLFRLDSIPVGPAVDQPARVMAMADGAAPPGVFAGRMTWDFNAPYVTRPRSDGRFDSLRVVTNRRRIGRDTTEYATLGYDRGILRSGAYPDGVWERLDDSGTFEARIPWALLNFTDPSARRVLQQVDGQPGSGLTVEDATQVISGIGLVAAARDHQGAWHAWPASGSTPEVAQVSWSTWEEPQWRERRRPAFEALRTTFATLDSIVLEGRSSQ